MVTFQACCSLLGIFGEVGRPNSLRPFIPSPKFLRPIPQFFFRTNFFRSSLRLFWYKIFWGRYWDFFETKIFETDTETFFETKVFETDTETFFRDQIFSRPILRLFLRPNIFVTDTGTFFQDQNFRDRDRYSQKIDKSLDTEKSRDEMSHSHSACCSFYVSSYLLCQEQSTLWSVVPPLVMIGVWPSYEILFDDIAPCLYLSGYMCFCQTFDI